MACILVIDDDEIQLATFQQALTAMGHSVVTATDGVKGAKLFRTKTFDVIITDIVMPNRDGLETIMTLRREFPAVRVIAMTELGITKLYLGLATRLGAHCTLEKPVTL